MQWLNYHHLLYFWTVVREGSVGRAAETLSLTQPTVSSQLKALETSLGEKLLERSGRRLVPTEVGRMVFGYADEIFGLGRELLDTLNDRPTGRPLRLVVGVADVMPKLIVQRLLAPALRLGSGVHLVCREDKTDRLLVALSTHELDVVLADTPMGAGVSVRAFNHLLGESGVTVFGDKALAAKLRPGFPGSLGGAPMLAPTTNTVMRRSLDQFFGARDIRPRIVAEFDDSALLKAFGESGTGVFPAPSVIEEEVCRSAHVRVVGRLAEVRERLYAISIEKRLKHPAVVAISETARHELFGEGNGTRG
jgi:LysR family transcriptional activator of nhaA